MAKPVVQKRYTLTERVYLVEILKGLGITLRHFLANFAASLKPGPHTVPTTWQYPEDRREISPVFRGAHMLLLDEQGREKCIGCGMCARVCPAQCITVERGKVPEGEEEEYAKRYAKKTFSAVFRIDLLRCIFCGFCEETCPQNALALGPDYELARPSREECLLEKPRMLENYRRAMAAGGVHRPLKPVPVAEAGPAKGGAGAQKG
ncbi:NADH-quinone oxidoreductase subunit I [Dissulfurirhabdus thermomarina]|uniref:NADH-quinone oxidoreductase subunit I n=1 Tax=Dissulfurirhabdus thermomarina TaxID=1765737 RepID=A0A6N9TJN4_DISTH|nr:NADH-quinone oxidoreductase subunit I [Dissulfurirhabdus thermomarina]NDY41472.1 NADH-quinone oxidoreductase subunit I [Dissulfurirhabdus thermomarina]NMX24246.1 NADH-quinone oxidoreductase subunit I [Dissulfurirhabdus thermomarina]